MLVWKLLPIRVELVDHKSVRTGKVKSYNFNSISVTTEIIKIHPWKEPAILRHFTRIQKCKPHGGDEKRWGGSPSTRIHCLKTHLELAYIELCAHYSCRNGSSQSVWAKAVSWPNNIISQRVSSLAWLKNNYTPIHIKRNWCGKWMNHLCVLEVT